MFQPSHYVSVYTLRFTRSTPNDTWSLRLPVKIHWSWIWVLLVLKYCSTSRHISPIISVPALSSFSFAYGWHYASWSTFLSTLSFVTFFKITQSLANDRTCWHCWLHSGMWPRIPHAFGILQELCRCFCYYWLPVKQFHQTIDRMVRSGLFWCLKPGLWTTLKIHCEIGASVGSYYIKVTEHGNSVDQENFRSLFWC